jgi:chromosome segregation ATPase
LTRKIFFGIFLTTMLCSGCSYSECQDEIRFLKKEMKEVRAVVKRWGETTNKLEAELTMAQKGIDKINVELASDKENVGWLKEEWRDLRIGELAGWKADLQAMQKKCDAVADDLMKMKKGLNVVTTKLNDTEKKAAEGKL